MLLSERSKPALWILVALIPLLLSVTLPAADISLQATVTPSTVILKDGHPVTFAVHGFIEFRSLSELFPYIESQSQRWKDRSDFGEPQRQLLARELLRRGIESRIVSMADER